ncbi:hypothetical protein K438DRAFT_1780190 [Mycena galopus ATCC 62051]|nr:hypothetical protein K438DRAFT_1780190 [Mycena galopus ATCC 62051]
MTNIDSHKWQKLIQMEGNKKETTVVKMEDNWKQGSTVGRSPTSDSIRFCDQALSRASGTTLLSLVALVPSSLPKNMSVAHARPALQRRDFICPAADPLGGTLSQGGNSLNTTVPCYYSPTMMYTCDKWFIFQNGTFVAGSGFCPPKLAGKPPTVHSHHQLDPVTLNSISFNAIHNVTVGGTKYVHIFLYAMVSESIIHISFSRISSASLVLSSTTETSVPMPRKQMTSGTIAGIVLGVFFIITIMLPTFLLRKRRNQGQARDRPKPEAYPYLYPMYETPSSSKALTSPDALSASPSTEARRQANALKGDVAQPSAPYHEEENSSLQRTNEDLQARVRTLEMQLQSPWTGDFSSEGPPGYLE